MLYFVMMENNKNKEKKKPSLIARAGMAIGGVALATSIALGGYKIETAQNASEEREVAALEVQLKNNGTVLKVGDKKSPIKVIEAPDFNPLNRKVNEVVRPGDDSFGTAAYAEEGAVNLVDLPDDMRDQGGIGVVMAGKVPVPRHIEDVADNAVQSWVIKQNVSSEQAESISVRLGLTDTPNSQVNGSLGLTESGDLVLSLSMPSGVDEQEYYNTRDSEVVFLVQ